ncbi:hypothetical protein M5K25_002631 [Dendrobium thyrsiflorum]|uniref:Uncharacterized protein n=1 Tax=Dendrobium thyrsiflorum TaxID=117978 RepID=A0ABD0VNS9_DENTH
MSRLLLYFGGELQVTTEFTPIYVGGRNRPIIIEDIIPLVQQKLRIIHALQYNSPTQTINIVCRICNNGKYATTHVIDDEVCEYMLLEARRRTITVYVEAEEVLPRELTETSTTTFIFHVAGPSTQNFQLQCLLTFVDASAYASAQLICNKMLSHVLVLVSDEAWDAQPKAIQAIFGTYEESYPSLYRFIEATCIAILGTVYNIELVVIFSYG